MTETTKRNPYHEKIIWAIQCKLYEVKGMNVK